MKDTERDGERSATGNGSASETILQDLMELLGFSKMLVVGVVVVVV